MPKTIDTLLLASAAALVGCGGGGGSASPSGNRAPVFTSPTTSTAPEASGANVYTATASDADSDALAFTISGGADAARFTLAAGGALSFVAPPDFEGPTDFDHDNVYRVQLTVSDGSASAVLDLAVTVTDTPDGFRVRRVASGLAQPLFVTGIPDGSGRVLLVQKGGLIRILDPATGAIAATPFLDATSQVSTDSERGLLGLALAPDFAASGRCFVYLTNIAGNIEIRQYATLPGNRNRVDPAGGDVILTVAHPGASNHNGGWIDFGPDGNLYIATGDGGGGGDPGGNAQNPNALLGKILRIDVRSDAFPADPGRDYAIPATNPFASAGGAPEVWALGLRNPFRNSFDTATGILYLADVGQNVVEEVDLVPAGADGLNFGWNRREGTQAYNGGANASGFTAPVAEYLHGSGAFQGNSITGGYVYRGPVAALRGLYIFADFVSANIWSIPVASLVQGQTFASGGFTPRRSDFAPDTGIIDQIASFGTDQVGNLYIVGIDGEVFVIEAA